MDGSASAVCAQHITRFEVCLANPFLIVILMLLDLPFFSVAIASILCCVKIFIFINIRDPGIVNVPENEIENDLWDDDSGIGTDIETEQVCYCYYKRWDDSYMYGKMHSSKGNTIIENLKLRTLDIENAHVYEYGEISKMAYATSASNGTFIDAYLKIWNQSANSPFCSLKLSLHPTNRCSKIFMEALMVGKPISLENRPVAGFLDLSRIEEFTNICMHDREARCCLFVRGLKLGLKLFRGTEDDSTVIGDIDCLAINQLDVKPLMKTPSDYFVKGGGINIDLRMLW